MKFKIRKLINNFICKYIDFNLSNHPYGIQNPWNDNNHSSKENVATYLNVAFLKQQRSLQMQQLWDLIARNAVKVARTFWTTFLREWYTHIFICIRFYRWVSYRTDDNRNNGYLFCEKKHRILEDPLFLPTGVTVQTRSKKYNLSFNISFFDHHIISIFLIFIISNSFFPS